MTVVYWWPSEGKVPGADDDLENDLAFWRYHRTELRVRFVGGCYAVWVFACHNSYKVTL